MEIQIGKNSIKKICLLILSFITVSLAVIPLSAKTASAEISYDKSIATKSVYLTETGTGEVLFAKNENERLTIASMTKIMLLNLVFEAVDSGNLSFDEEITVSENASGMGGSQVFLEKNGKYKAEDLIKSVIIASANDASVALAERLFGCEAECVSAMNKKCEEWKLENTLFSNCTGLPKPTQYSSAKDVSVMLSKLITHKEYFRFSKIWTDEITHNAGRKTGLTNTNKLVRFYDGCDGGKTGFTSESGFCLAATAKRGALRLIAVAIDSPDSKTRFAEVSSMFNYGFDNFTSKMAVDSSKPLEIKAEVDKGVKEKVKIIPENDVFVFGEKSKKQNVTIDFKPDKIRAPIKSGEKAGELIVFKNNVEYKRVNVLAAEDIAKKTYFAYIKDIARKW